MARLILCLMVAFGVVQAPGAESEPLWILVVAPGLKEATAKLAEHRRAQGFKVIVMDRETVSNGQSDLTKLTTTIGDTQDVNIVLAGAIPAGQATHFTMRTPAGLHSRMKGRMTDHTVSHPEADATPRWAVGRLPATSPDEARAMVDKIIRFEQDSGPHMARLVGLAGHPGGQGAMRTMNEYFINGLIAKLLAAVPPPWQTKMFVHIPSSPHFQNGDTGHAFLHEWSVGALVALYLGHSNETGCYSDATKLVSREDLLTIPHEHSAIFFSCGCFALKQPRQVQVKDSNDPSKTQVIMMEGYGFAAMRNPKGPPAVIAAQDESFAAMGLLALDGMLSCFAKDKAPASLGELWIAAMKGITRGPIDDLAFNLMDMADGSKGKMTLTEQRLEHAEMWHLLGDPAMRLPAISR